MQNETAVGISIGLAVKGLSQISELKKGFDGLKSKISQAKNAVTSLDSAKLSNLSAQIKSARKELFSELTSNLGAIANSAAIGLPIKLAIDDEAAFANVKKYVDDTDENLTTLKNSMRGLSTSLGKSFGDIAQIAVGGGKINLKGDELVAYTKMLATGSVAFEMSVDALSRAANNMKVGFKMDNLDRLNDFFDRVNLLDNKVTNANADEIFEATSLTAANASLIGLSATDAAAISSTMLSTGKATSVVGTSLNALYSTLSMADKKGKAFQEALASIGMDAGYLKAALAKDAAGAITTFLEAISKADKDKQAGLLYDLVGGNFNDEIAGLVTNIDALKENMRLARSNEAIGSMQKELQTKLDTTKSGIERLTQAWRNLGSNLGETFLPLTNAVASVLGGIAGALSELNSKFPTLSAVIVSAVAGFMMFKPLLLIGKIALLSVADGFLGVVKILKFLNPLNLVAAARWSAHAFSLAGATLAAKAHAFSIWLVGARLRATLAITTAYSAASKAFGVACGVMRSGLMAVTLATKAMKFALISTGIGAIVVALGMAAAYLIENWDEVKAFFLEIWESVKPYWQSTTKFFSDLWQGVSDFLSAIFEPVIKIWDELFGGFFDWIAEKFGWINDMVGEAIKGLSSAWSKTKEFFGFGDDEQASSELKPKDDSGGFFNSIFGSDNDTNAEAPALVAASTGGGTINISFNGDFLLNSNNGKFDLESFKAQITRSVKEALKRDEFNSANTEIREQR
ncbi:phage tail tape measure protein [Campylobacter concisus]|uniref:Phage tail tape measure protein n=1 Tax=Campylobacter concisus TaxID=199 RepID=A0A1Y5NG39_9BACT|nr:phage tail tape measure protein [Campylobacter concisus]OUT18434.1 phage tail tape measure protein [Campylobacter concisus]